MLEVVDQDFDHAAAEAAKLGRWERERWLLHLRHGILAVAMDIPSFELGVESAGERLTFIPRGELDLATAPELEHRVLGAVREGAQAVVLDLRELTFMDSTGVRTIVAAHHVAEQTGHDFRVVRPARDSVVSRVIEISGIDDALGLVDVP